MESKIAEATALKYPPVALLLAGEKPEEAQQFKEDGWGCVMFMLAAVLKGRTVAFDRKTFGCFGGGVGLGFGDQYENFPGGKECFAYFLSIGNEHWETGRQAGERVKEFLRPEAYHHFMHGERYIKSPELVHKFIDELPIADVGENYVVFKPLDTVDGVDEVPEVVSFFGDMDQIAALTVLANFGSEHNENVIFPYAAGCQTLGIYPLGEAGKERPRAVLGLSDISARLYLKKIVKDDLLSFSVPWALFKEMEGHVDESFLRQDTWQRLLNLKQE